MMLYSFIFMLILIAHFGFEVYMAIKYKASRMNCSEKQRQIWTYSLLSYFSHVRRQMYSHIRFRVMTVTFS